MADLQFLDYVNTTPGVVNPIWPIPIAPLRRNRKSIKMEEETIPADISQFILQNLDAVALLEGLLLMRANPSVSWNARMVSSRLYISENEASGVLAVLATRGFLKKDAESLSFMYIPVSAEMANMVDRVADLYARCLVPVTKLIHSKSSSKIQQFADAFRMRKDKQ